MRLRRPTGPRSPALLLFGVASLALHAAVGAAFLPRAEAFHPIAVTLAGETLDLDQAEAPAPAEEPAETTPVVTPDDLPLAPAPPPAPRISARPTAAAATGSASAGVPSPPPLPFGAAGVRYASDLATTFTRSFPQAASSDAAWVAAPLGSAGTATISLVIDEEGRLVSSAVLGSPATALRRGIERTLALLAPRAFTASAAITRLKVSARVTRDDVHDGLHGEVFALSGGSFAGDVGSAFFALPGGAGASRRIDVEVRLLP